MCGICGIVHREQATIDKEKLSRMNAALIHRGPDNEGYFIQAGVGLAMRRLKIIDLLTGDQPMTNEDRSIWVVFNGEIYNFPSLRQELEKKGHHFVSHSDTECILHLYEQYGVKALDHLRGMFAIALWDANKRLLLLARDRFGKKPLFYSLQGNSLYFSSELASLLKGLPDSPEIDLSAINLYLSLQYIPDPQTAYLKIFKLPPAHYLLWKDGAVHLQRYWNLEYLPKHTGSHQELKEELQNKVRESVQMRMISDVPLGAHLSGGIDSSIIVSEMAALSSAPVRTFSIGFKEESFSELPYAKAVADRYKTDHHEFVLDYGDIPQTIEEIIHHVGEPLADPSLIPLFHLSKLTREHVTVALNGDGGDESFGGYQRYWLDPLANLYARLPGFLTQKLFPALIKLFPQKNDKPIGADYLDGFQRLKTLTGIDPRASVLRWGSFFSPDMLSQLWSPTCRHQININQAEEFLVQLFEKTNAESFLDKTLYTDTHSYLPGDLLVKADRMAMAHSLESRSPFLDHELAQWAARLPEKYKVSGLKGKILLRETYQTALPESVQQRRKQGFGIPISNWCRGALSGWLKEVLLDAPSPFCTWFNQGVLQQLITEHQDRKFDHGKRLWALAVLSIWSNGYA